MANRVAGKKKAVAERKLKLEPHQIILRPLVTEKGVYQSEAHRHYAFEVNPLATKTEIKNAVEQLFNVEVGKVATQNRKGKSRRYRFRIGQTKGMKRAIVRLKGDGQIDFV
ncbi:MAG: 50S ribosomal protein L23 [Pirellulaceae bacterium]